MIEIERLSKHYRAPDGRVTDVLKNITLQVPEASITAVVAVLTINA